MGVGVPSDLTDFAQKREALRAQLDALPAGVTGQRDKIASEVAADG